MLIDPEPGLFLQTFLCLKLVEKPN